MPSLRIGIDVGGTFTHGVALEGPGVVAARAVTPTTHRHPQGVAEGVRQVLAALMAQVDPARVELVAHSTTQATNALLEGDLAPVIRVLLAPPGEGWLARQALGPDVLCLGAADVPLRTVVLPLDGDLAHVPVDGPDAAQQVDAPAPEPWPVAVVQPLAGGQTLRECEAAALWTARGHAVVCAGDISRVLGLSARARTAVVNAAMLPRMLATADYTEAAVSASLAGVPLMVVRSDGGAMTIGEMRRQPVQSLLSGPAAGASAALALSGLSEVVFLEVGGTSTDITLIKEGRVRHRSAEVGGQRLMVPALDLRTVAVGGGSMLRADASRFGPRSAHIAGLPYLFQALSSGRQVEALAEWHDTHGVAYTVARLDDGSLAALTLTDWHLAQPAPASGPDPARELLGEPLREFVADQLQHAFSLLTAPVEPAFHATLKLILEAVRELARAHRADLAHFTVAGGGGGAPVVLAAAATALGRPALLVPEHAVISAIGAALAVTCVSLAQSVAEPTAADLAELTARVEERLRAQGAERVATDFEFDPHRRVLTVTGRGSRPYAQDAAPRSAVELQALAAGFLGAGVDLAWDSPAGQLWLGADGTGRPGAARRRHGERNALALDRFGRSLWHGAMRSLHPAPPGQAERERVLTEVLARYTAYTDGGPDLPGLALLCDGRFIPLDSLGRAELIAEAIRYEHLPDTAPACFILRA